MGTQGIPLYDFGPFRLDADDRQLLRNGEPVPLTPKVFDTLQVLVENHGRLVLKEDLLKTLWPDTFVAEANLTQAVFTLRKALGESGTEQHYLATVPRRGYRFTADVRQAPREEATQHSAVADAVPDRVASARRPLSRSWMTLAAIVVLPVAIAAIGVFYASRPGSHPQIDGTRPLLAVLPFENLTGDPTQDYFTDGLTDEMIHQIGKADPPHLGVIARTSIMHYKHGAQNVEEIGRDLRVQYVLEGSVRRDAQKVRITAQLIKVSDQTHIWAREYDRELADLLTLQAAIAQEIAGEVRRTFGDVADLRSPASLVPRSTSVYEAYDLYLKGRYFWNKRTRAGFEQAIDCFERAIALDPGYARAYAGLADAHALIASYSLGTESVSKARSAALRALELDEQLAEAHTSLALIVENHDWDWRKAEQEFRRAIQLDPNYATAHHWYAEFLTFQGRFDEAFAEIERARVLDPLSLIMAADQGALLMFARRYDLAIEQFRAVLAVEPDFARAHMIIGAYAETQRFDEALAEIEKWRRTEDTPWTWSAEVYVYRRWGRQREARRALVQLEDVCRRLGQDPTPFLAGAYAGIDNTKAIAYLERSYAERSNGLTAIKVDPGFDPLRGDPRFHDLMRRVGFAP